MAAIVKGDIKTYHCKRLISVEHYPRLYQFIHGFYEKYLIAVFQYKKLLPTYGRVFQNVDIAVNGLLGLVKDDAIL